MGDSPFPTLMIPTSNATGHPNQMPHCGEEPIEFDAISYLTGQELESFLKECDTASENVRDTEAQAATSCAGYPQDRMPEISQPVAVHNAAPGFGSGVAVQNAAAGFGSGVAVQNAAPVFGLSGAVHNAAPVFGLSGAVHNAAPGFGSDVAVHNAAPVFGSDVAVHNAAPGFGSDVAVHNAAPVFGSDVAVHNAAPVFGPSGAVHNAYVERPKVEACIVSTIKMGPCKVGACYNQGKGHQSNHDPRMYQCGYCSTHKMSASMGKVSVVAHPFPLVCAVE